GIRDRNVTGVQTCALPILIVTNLRRLGQRRLRILQLRSQRIRLLSKRLQLSSGRRRVLREERICSLRCSRRRVAAPSLLQRRLRDRKSVVEGERADDGAAG